MILSICPNPSIDRTIELDSLNVGMINKIENKVETYSGKALNVAIGVARLGGNSLASGFMFDTHRVLFEQALKKDGVKFDFVNCAGAARVNYKIIDKKSMLTEINDRGEKVDRIKQIELLEKTTALSKLADIVVISGSLPRGLPETYYGELASCVDRRAKLIIDTERKNTLAAVFSREVFMVKPNLSELENFSGMKIHTKYEMIEAAQKYIDKGVKYVLISLGANGAILSDGSNNYYCKSANVAVNSTVGAGDSMIAAACIGLEKGVCDEELLKMSVAAGTAAVTTSGTNLFYKDKYDEIYKQIFVEKIK